MGRQAWVRWLTLLASVAGLSAGAAGAGEGVSAEAMRWQQLEQRLQALEARNAELEVSLGDDHLRDSEPELVTRLKAVEFQALGMQKQARMVEALEGITAGLSLTQILQQSRSGTPDDARLNYRGDVFISLPGGEVGQASGAIFAQFRLGQGEGLSTLPSSFSGSNAAAFALADESPDNSVALLAQAWYQLDVPLPLGGYKPRSKETLTLNFGKLDPFLFFDQNSIADDETTRFINSALVHNPLLDAGGDIGVDSYGFTPGLRLAYSSEQYKPTQWGLSLGVFGAGSGAQYAGHVSQNLLIAQLELSALPMRGLRGNYRLYGWHNRAAVAFANEFDARRESHRGLGLSLDQRLGDALTVFARLGWSTAGRQRFDRAWTLGLELGGNDWGRSADALGLAWGRLRASNDFERLSATLDADADGNADFGWQANGAEQLAELYYRWRLNPQFELGPDLQWLHQPAANTGVADSWITGLRAQLTF